VEVAERCRPVVLLRRCLTSKEVGVDVTRPAQRMFTMLTYRTRYHSNTAWMDNVKTWTGLPVEESVRMTEDRDKWRRYVHRVVSPRIDDG